MGNVLVTKVGVGQHNADSEGMGIGAAGGRDFALLWLHTHVQVV